MKRVFALILALCMACALFACGKKQTEVAPGGDSPTVTPGATDPGSGPAENPGGSTGVPGGAGSTGNAGNGGNTTGSTGSGWAGTRVAVIYFSCTGSTRTAAERIRDMTGADLYELTPEQPYTSQDLSYNNDACRASQEQKDPAARPRIAGQPLDLSQYGTIYLGYPIWWGTAPRIINTFLDTYDLTGKTHPALLHQRQQRHRDVGGGYPGGGAGGQRDGGPAGGRPRRQRPEGLGPGVIRACQKRALPFLTKEISLRPVRFHAKNARKHTLSAQSIFRDVHAQRKSPWGAPPRKMD